MFLIKKQTAQRKTEVENGEERSLHIVSFRIQIQSIISLLLFLLELVS